MIRPKFRAWADQSRGVDSRVQLAIDADDDTGWVTAVGKPHFAVFELAEPVAASESAELRVTLEFNHRMPHFQLGCFRLSVGQKTEGDAIQPAWGQFLERVADRYGFRARPRVRPLDREGPLATLIIAYRS